MQNSVSRSIFKLFSVVLLVSLALQSMGTNVAAAVRATEGSSAEPARVPGEAPIGVPDTRLPTATATETPSPQQEEDPPEPPFVMDTREDLLHSSPDPESKYPPRLQQAVEVPDLGNPRWKILFLIYPQVDFTYTNGSGQHHVVTGMTQAEQTEATSRATRFAEQDVPALTSGAMWPTLTIRTVARTLTNLDDMGGDCYWPGPDTAQAERDPLFDSVIVVWDPTGTDENTGQPADLGPCAAGFSWEMGVGQTYMSFRVESLGWYGQNIFKHEWGHSILFYYDDAGISPDPAVDNHINDTTNRYVHCPSGVPYVLQDETDDNPIPNSIYNNTSGFTHDYYSGTTARPETPDICLGLNETVWATGGPVTKPPAKPGIEVLANGGLEDADPEDPANLPYGWQKDAWNWSYSTFTWDDQQAHSGARSVKIVSSPDNDARWVQTVAVQPDSDYRFSGWIKTENITNSEGDLTWGANLSTLDPFNTSTPVLYGTHDWTYMSYTFNTGSTTEIQVAARLGNYSAITSGTAWFDDLKLELLSTPVCHTLTVTIDPVDGGSVNVSGPANCNNGTQYVHGTKVELTALPVPGANFDGWSGGASGTDNAISIVMTEDKSVIAHFIQAQYTLTVSKTGTGSGLVASHPAEDWAQGINCGLVCSGTYGANVGVWLDATPDPGSTFTGWSDPCVADDTYPSCTFNLTSDRTVTATFMANPRISGNVGVGGATLSYTDGAPKTVTANNKGAYSFVISYGWSGTVTPSKAGYAFSPTSRSYTDVLADHTEQNYTAKKVASSFAAAPASWNFGTVNVGMVSAAEAFTITNTGTADLVIGPIALAGKKANQFQIVADSCSGRTIAPSGTCTFAVVFEPTSAGPKKAYINVQDHAAGSPHKIALAGKGGTR